MELKSIQSASQEAVQRIMEQDAAGKAAAASIWPGPLAGAFALAQDVPVGRWRVRAFCDIDFEFMHALDHPLSRIYADALEGKATAAQFVPTGLPMWQAAWVLTRSVDEVEAVLAAADGAQALSKAARAEFARLPAKGLTELFKAIMKQVERSMSTAIEHEDAPEEGEAAKAAANPPLSLLQKTG